jgi:hypothetical protein
MPITNAISFIGKYTLHAKVEATEPGTTLIYIPAEWEEYWRKQLNLPLEGQAGPSWESLQADGLVDLVTVTDITGGGTSAASLEPLVEYDSGSPPGQRIRFFLFVSGGGNYLVSVKFPHSIQH